MSVHSIRLHGCRQTPLAHYLKALGILRVLSEQLDPTIRGAWKDGLFVLHTRLEPQIVVDFFLHQYAPTPIASPWNGGSGFYPKDNSDALDAIEASESPRFALYRQVLSTARHVVSRMGLEERPDTKGTAGGDKGKVLELCRGLFPDEALPWLDASYLLTTDGPKYPPLLGTGGNDGRLEFSQNAMQRLLELIEPETGLPTEMAEPWLRGALFDEIVCGLQLKAAIGQFHPGAAGGANMSQGFDASSLINPWDYVLMLEGALMFAAAASRRWRASHRPGTLAYPFTVRTSGVGYGSASLADEGASRAEMWMPLWETPASVGELSSLFAEARMKDGQRVIKNGVDFALAIARLGFDRGLSGFQRYGFQERNGLAYFAVPLDVYQVPSKAGAKQIADIEVWLERFRRSASDKTTPAAMLRARRQLDDAVMAVCQRDDPSNTLRLLLRLGACERLLAKRTKWIVEKKIPPLPPLSAAWWDGKLEAIFRDSLPLRLACSLASTYGVYRWTPKESAAWWPMRAFLEPSRSGGVERPWVSWDEQRKPLVPWQEGDLYTVLAKLFGARILRARAAEKAHVDGGPGPRDAHDKASHDRAQRPPSILERAVIWSSPDDIIAFLQRGLSYDEQQLFVDALWGFSLLNWRAIRPSVDTSPEARPDRFLPGALYGLLKLTHAGQLVVTQHRQGGARLETQFDIPVHPGIFRQAQAGDGRQAAELAIRRLRGSGLAPMLSEGAPLSLPTDEVLRAAAAVGFVISPYLLHKLADGLCRLDAESQEPGEPDPHTASSTSPMTTDIQEETRS